MKTIVVTFAGRKMFMEILFPYIKKYEDKIDEYHIYAATNNQEDLDYIERFSAENKFVKVFRAEGGKDPIYLWNECYKNSQEEDAVYLKLDDDIVFIDDHLFSDFLDFRKKNPQYPIIYPMIINNVYTSWVLQDKMSLEFSQKTSFNERWDTVKHRISNHLKEGNPIPDRLIHLIPEDFMLCPVGWGDVEFAKSVHNKFLECLETNQIETFKNTNDSSEGMVLHNHPPVSINCCAWLGSGMKEYTAKYGDVWQDELWLSVYLPILAGQPNYIYFNSIVSHFSYYRQMQDGILNSNILTRYNKIKDLL
jgi:hypothetical protein